ncbi:MULTISPECIES: exodeoxyribonuclease V subunit alpha [unclassified Oceanispirochaeta]|uniref:exodeoxyribonuclease V subunit alpha n=1 Tax=unclassified Oceanispirochaeta TaxID=2635722 RepID=UPI000E09C7B1|nr:MULTISPECIES: exodeoxyribonuclease V subunit alpha [unclassified Oceanispirochaeta]MBF9018495.1 exodeoxyribonuclease V subunit alpha [Oceanispirochaeta sp. M2]NPD74902.1 exodeoxyribonuclease V subunit alpha [Oceanispirochaeta sp. M1]RDG29234.1 exodeoxyribonuclease V subunit alpha [Oceanispirochaeta sp. M1]
MIRSRSRAIQRFLDLKSVRENPPADLIRRLAPGDDAGRFARLAFKTGAEALWIQSAESMVKRYADRHQNELRWLLLYFLELSARGHIRISADDLIEDFPLWGAPAFDGAAEIVDALSSLIQDNPRLFATLEEGGAALLYAEDYSYFYLLKKRRFEENFLKVLGSITEQDHLSLSGQIVLLDKLYEELKDSAPMPMSDDTLQAAHMLSRSRMSIITGGPGTGKTTILAGLLNLYLESCLRNSDAEVLPEVRLCAPTGRAAKRMMESMESLLQNSRMAPAFVHPAETIHKTLGLKPGTLPRFDENRSLQADVVVVDEASMVDLNLMTMVLKAMKPGARLLLVGDRDQLPSVESGALLSDLLHGLGSEGHRLKDRVLSLTTVHRNSGAIREVSTMVIEADSSSFKNFIKEPERELSPVKILNGEGGLVRSSSLPSYRNLLDEIISLLKKSGPLPGSAGFSIPSISWQKEKDEIAACFMRFRGLAVLTPTRKGLFGTVALNRGLNDILSPRSPEAYHGQPVMVTRNDYERNLYNGDRGVVLRFQDGLFACFEDSDHEYRMIPLPLLEDMETAYAVTIHKSQGSEFRCVYVLIPEGSERLLSREILYTGITRAREGLILYGSVESFELCLGRGVRRFSGIRDFMLQT